MVIDTSYNISISDCKEYKCQYNQNLGGKNSYQLIQPDVARPLLGPVI